MKILYSFSRALILLVLLASIITCRSRRGEDIARKDLFSLKYGKLENQIDLFQIPGRTYQSGTAVFMRGGLFYLTDGNSRKLMEFTSYGDLIFMLYNPSSNPRPTLLNTDVGDREKTTKQAVAFDFNSPGKTVVSSFNDIYMIDRVGDERSIRDKKRGVVLNRILLHFNKKGEFLNFIGQEGIGGSPFPYIDGLYITKYDQLIVITRTPKAWEIFWFKPDGEILHHVSIDVSTFSSLIDKEMSISIERIIPDRVLEKIYISVSVFKDIIDPATRVKSTVKRIGGRIYQFDMRANKLGGYLEIPEDKVQKPSESNGEIEQAMLPSYELFGITEDHFYYLLRYESNNRTRLLILNSNGKVMTERTMLTGDSSLIYRYLSMDASGIVYGMLANDERARIVWWRTDKILARYKESGYE